MEFDTGKIFKFIFKSLLIIPAIILIFITFYSSAWYVNPDECHSIADLHYLSRLEIFHKFFQGANFFPLYKFLLKILYDIFGYDKFWIYKIPSLFAGILSVFMFYKLVFRFFHNKFISLAAYIFFVLNYEVLYYSSQIKPYIFDLLFCIVILYGFLKFEAAEINLTVNSKRQKLFISALYAFVCFMSWFSVSAVIVWHSCLLFAFTAAVLKKEKTKIISLLIFESGVLLFNLFEYVTYVRFMTGDPGLNEMWKGDWFSFAPESFDAINSLFNFIFYRFVWFDADTDLRFSDKFLFFILLFYLSGIIAALKDSRKKYIAAPFLMTLIFSFLGIYPFCNRPAVFLIPAFIIIPFCIFDAFKLKTFVILSVIPVTVLLYFYIQSLLRYNYLSVLFTKNDEFYNEYRYNIKQLFNIKDNEVMLSLANVCLSCNDNDKIYTDNITDYDESDLHEFIKNISSGADIFYFNYNQTDIKEEEVLKVKQVIERNNFDCSYRYTTSAEYCYYKCFKIR